LVRQSHTFFLTGHERPDGDTVGSELAFASFLKRQGKRVIVANTAPVPRLYTFLKGVSQIKTASHVSGRFDCAVVFECSGPERMGNIIDLKTQAKSVINIDHHVHHGDFGDINFVNPRTSSNSEQLCYIFEQAHHPMNRDEATALYVGLVTDSGRFQHNSTSSDSHAVAAELLRCGVDVAAVSRQLYGTRPVSALQLLSHALAGLRLVKGGKVSVITLTPKDFKAARAQPEDTEDIVNYGLLPPGVWVSLFIHQLPDGKTKVSLRGHGKVDLSRVAAALGGGGHKNAAGLTSALSPTLVEKRLLALLTPVLP
jgi:phosphoesterase RecJ-like protein